MGGLSPPSGGAHNYRAFRNLRSGGDRVVPATRITERFVNSSGGNSGALLPYFTAGFPDGATTAEVIRAADAVGAVAVEIGVPYSDSIADGPIIQGSFTYVLDHGWTLEDTFNLVSEVRPAVGCGLIAMLSYSIVHRVGVDAFMTRAAVAGFVGIIVPVLPVEQD